MGFFPITIDAYIIKHLASNPEQNENELRDQLNHALKAYKNGQKCACGADIWVIGSAFSGHKYFECISGKASPDFDFEIDTAIKKKEGNTPEIFDDDLDFLTGGSYFDDDGNELDPNSVPIPALCLNCRFYEDPYELVLCNLNRLDQRDDEEFICYAFRPK
jgi:hypothetical protein